MCKSVPCAGGKVIICCRLEKTLKLNPRSHPHALTEERSVCVRESVCGELRARGREGRALVLTDEQLRLHLSHPVALSNQGDHPHPATTTTHTHTPAPNTKRVTVRGWDGNFNFSHFLWFAWNVVMLHHDPSDWLRQVRRLFLYPMMQGNRSSGRGELLHLVLTSVTHCFLLFVLHVDNISYLSAKLNNL